MTGGPVQQPVEVVAVRPAGAYHSLAFTAPVIAERARPGQFVALAVGGEDSALVARRCLSIHWARAGTVEVIFAVAGPGTRWLAARRPGDRLEVVGPLGRPFPPPERPGPVTLVGGGYGAAPLFAFAERLRAGGTRVDLVLGAARADRLFGVLEAKRVADSVSVTTEDGSLGARGRVSDVLPGVLDRSGALAVYACGPMPMLAAVARLAGERGLPSQLAVEESMACGIGVCMTCVLPAVGDDGRTRMVRACVDGPVFAGERVRFDALGTVPADAVGARS